MANAYETGVRKNIPAVLIYARNDGRILMIHRDAPDRAVSDYHSGKWNGLGGKSEVDESAWQTAAREFEEESGLRLDSSRFQALGVLQFPNFRVHKSEDWTVFVFTLDLDTDEISKIQTQSEEGSLHWIPTGDLLKLNLWPGDREFIPYVVERKSFLGTIWYEGARVGRSDVRLISK